MSIIPTADCFICKRPDVTAINRDWINRYSVPEILVKRGIEQTKETVKAMTFHGLSHVTSPTLAIARQIIQDDAVNLVNTVHETNMQILQLREMRKATLERMAKETDNNVWQKLNKNLIDIQDKANKAVTTQHKISGKDAQQEVVKVSLARIAQEAIKEASKGKDINEIRDNIDKKKKSIQDHVFDPDNLDMIMQRLKYQQDIEPDEDEDYEIEDEEEENESE